MSKRIAIATLVASTLIGPSALGATLDDIVAKSEQLTEISISRDQTIASANQLLHELEVAGEAMPNSQITQLIAEIDVARILQGTYSTVLSSELEQGHYAEATKLMQDWKASETLGLEMANHLLDLAKESHRIAFVAPAELAEALEGGNFKLRLASFPLTRSASVN